jgi:starch synthase (maltosyl-transferring)
MRMDLKQGHVIIERMEPQINGGRYRAKAVVGDEVEVSADIYRDGPAVLRAVIRYRGPSSRRWQEAPMRQADNDRWVGTFPPDKIGVWRYTVEGWTDRFATWRRDLIKRLDAGQDVDVELEEGALMMEARLGAVPASRRKKLQAAIDAVRAERPSRKRDGAGAPPAAAVVDPQIESIMTAYGDRSGSTVASPALELFVDRERARFGAWYEFFPRSTGTKTKHGTFETAKKELPRIAAMGFDVVYLPPIHPIGKSYRKGKNNKLEARPTDVGSPWAIGGDAGGHRDVHPDLGTIEDFDGFVAEAQRQGLEVALDFAIQCSPDHPWVTEHPEWFVHRPDGTIRYAENPPKKYQDIYPINFDTEDKEGLWLELKGILEHWISHGVKIFRVDNPHTKTFPFWEWVIEELKSEHPDLILLAEAFTRPKVMRHLAKIGFTQSYTYFTWRNEKWEIIEYLNELTRSEMRHYFRPNFFVNTPDILHEYLQMGGPPAFKVRLVLAAFLSPSYGVYSGYELYENVPAETGSEEYLNSEKFELRPRDYSRSDSLIPYITRINEIRHKHPALSELTNLSFHHIDKDHMLAFSKRSPGQDAILVIVNLNPFHWGEATVNLDLDALGVEEGREFEVHDLITETTYVWRGSSSYVRLDPFEEPAHVFRIEG